MKDHVSARSFLPPLANALLFYGLTVALLLPLWGFKYFPSQDGPLHLYNAVVLCEYNRADRPEFRDYFVPNPALAPNWLAPHLLPILVRVFSPIVAEKLLLTAYLILMPVAARYAMGAIRHRGRLLSLAVLPMVPNQFYHLGFHDFCLSLAGYFFIVGFVLKRRRDFGAQHAVALAVMLVVLYLTHLASLVMVLPLLALTTVATVWLGRVPVTRKLRGSLALLAAMLPVVVWAAYFALASHRGSNLAFWPKGWHHRLVLVVLWMKSYQYMEALAGLAMLLLVVGGSLWMIVRARRRRRLFIGLPGGLLATVIFYLLLFLVAPDAFAGAQLLLIRVAGFIFFAVLLWWASLPIGSGAFAKLELAVAMISVPAALGLLVLHVRSYSELNGYLGAFEAVAPLLPAGATLVPIHYNDPLTLTAPTADGLGRHALSTEIDPFRHASAIGLAEAGVIDLGNSWATTDHQSLRWQPGLDPMNVAVDRLDDFTAYALRTHHPVDYVLLWSGGIRHSDAQAISIDEQLAAGYQLIYTSPSPGYLKLYRSVR